MPKSLPKSPTLSVSGSAFSQCLARSGIRAKLLDAICLLLGTCNLRPGGIEAKAATIMQHRPVLPAPRNTAFGGFGRAATYQQQTI